MSALPPVSDTPSGSAQDAINAALASSYVTDDLKTVNSYLLSGNLATPKYVAPSTAPGLTTSLGDHDLLVIGSGSILTVDPGNRPTYGAYGDAATDDPIATDGPKAVVAIGGSSNITFANGTDAQNTSFHYDVVAGTGFNTIALNNGPDLVQSTVGNDLITSGGGHDTITGGSGSDTIFTGGQSYVQTGTLGDRIDARKEIGSGGNDTVQASSGANTIYGGSGNLTVNLSGTTTNDSIFGSDSSHNVNVTTSATFGTFTKADPTDSATGDTLLHFSSGQTLEVKNVTITFAGDSTKHTY